MEEHNEVSEYLRDEEDETIEEYANLDEGLYAGVLRECEESMTIVKVHRKLGILSEIKIRFTSEGVYFNKFQKCKLVYATVSTHGAYYSVQDLLSFVSVEFFNELFMKLVTEKNGKIYPEVELPFWKQRLLDTDEQMRRRMKSKTIGEGGEERL